MGRRYKPRLMTVGEARHVMNPAQIDEDTQGWDCTIHHAKHMARIAASRVTFRGADLADLRDEALSGVMMQLAENPDSSIQDCIGAGHTAVSQYIDRLVQGNRKDGRNTGQRREMYWHDKRVHFDNYHLDELALSQVCGELGDDTRHTLTLAALHDTLIDAAAHAGVHPGTMRTKVRAARKRALTLWHDWETPPAPTISSRKRLKTHCNSGHEFTTDNTQWITDTRGNRQRRCATCNREAARRARERQAAAAFKDMLTH